jgi:nucleoside-diphosphate-sugar epimerase
MKVFVAGATGAIGKQLIPQLVAAGHEVTGMTRSPPRPTRCVRWAPRRPSLTGWTGRRSGRRCCGRNRRRSSTR